MAGCFKTQPGHAGIFDNCPQLQAGGHVLLCMLFADNVTPFRTSVADLQRLSNAMHEFCVCFGFVVNVLKPKP